jgi:hypothetical protein
MTLIHLKNSLEKKESKLAELDKSREKALKEVSKCKYSTITFDPTFLKKCKVMTVITTDDLKKCE